MKDREIKMLHGTRSPEVLSLQTAVTSLVDPPRKHLVLCIPGPSSEQSLTYMLCRAHQPQ